MNGSRRAEAAKRCFPHQFLYRILLAGKLEQYYQIEPKDSWMLAAAEKDLPILVPGWEDSTLGNTFASNVLQRRIRIAQTVKTGIEYMIRWPIGIRRHAGNTPLGSSRSAAA